MTTVTVLRLLCLLALANLLLACATASTPSASAPTPPVVDCELGTVSKPIPPLPATWVDTLGQLSVEASNWIADVFGIVEVERNNDGKEAACYQRLRDEGVIR